MKEIFSLSILLTIGAAILLPAQQPNTVPIGFINAVGLITKTDLQIDARALKPAGFSEGGSAASFGVAEGRHEFACTNDGCEKVTRGVDIRKGSSALYVLYKVATRGPDGTTKNVLKLTEIPQQASTQDPQFFAFSTLEGRLANLMVNGANVSIEPLKLTAIPGRSLVVEKEGNKPLRSTPRESANYVLILFDSSDAHMRWSLVEMTR